jgi:hypothetical protein
VQLQQSIVFGISRGSLNNKSRIGVASRDETMPNIRDPAWGYPES